MSQFIDLVKMFADEPSVVLTTGDVLFESGEPADCLYIVISGTLRIGNGKMVYEDVRTGGIVGEMGVVDGAPRSATVWAAAETRLVKITAGRFSAMIQQEPTFAIAIMQVMANRLRAMNRRLNGVESDAMPTSHQVSVSHFFLV